MVLLSAPNCLERNTWLCGEYLSTRHEEIVAALREHIYLTLATVGLGTLIAIPLVLIARRWHHTANWIGRLTSVLYTIPSLAFFALLLPITGLSANTVLVGLVVYSLVILFRNFLAGLLAVPDEVRESARAMGYRPLGMLLRVDIPLALPSIMAGLRIATVSTVALTTVGAVVGHGGLGNLIYDALSSDFKAEVATASVLCVALAIAADLLLRGAERLLTPWTRKGLG